MTLKTRVIATVLYDGRAVVKGRCFAADRVIGTPTQVVRLFASRDVDELVFLDVAATKDGRGPRLALIEQLAADASFPFAVGGGIRSVDDARAVIRAGADKVVIGRAAHHETAGLHLVQDVATRLGTQAVVVTIDSGVGSLWTSDADVQRAEALQQFGAGEILVQSIPRDGTMEGYDLDLVARIARAVTTPVIASGGCSGPRDMRRAVEAGAGAVAAGALFSFTDVTPATCRAYLRDRGVAVRA